MLRLHVPEISARRFSFRLIFSDFLAAQGYPGRDGNSEATLHLSEILPVQPISAHAQSVPAVPIRRRLGSGASANRDIDFGDRWVLGALGGDDLGVRCGRAPASESSPGKGGDSECIPSIPGVRVPEILLEKRRFVMMSCGAACMYYELGGAVDQREPVYIERILLINSENI